MFENFKKVNDRIDDKLLKFFKPFSKKYGLYILLFIYIISVPGFIYGLVYANDIMHQIELGRDPIEYNSGHIKFSVMATFFWPVAFFHWCSTLKDINKMNSVGKTLIKYRNYIAVYHFTAAIMLMPVSDLYLRGKMEAAGYVQCKHPKEYSHAKPRLFMFRLSSTTKLN